MIVTMRRVIVTMRRMSLWRRIWLVLSPAARRRHDEGLRNGLLWLVRNPDVKVVFDVFDDR